MSFAPLPKATPRGRPAPDGCRVGRRMDGGRLRVVVYMGPTALQRAGFHEGDRVEVQMGEGQDAGRLRFRRDPNGSHRIMRNATAGRGHSGVPLVRLSFAPEHLGERRFPLAQCRFDARPGTVTVQMPDWWMR